MASHNVSDNLSLLDREVKTELYDKFLENCDVENKEADKKQFFVALALWEQERRFNPDVRLFRFSWDCKKSRALYSTGLITSAINVACNSAYQLSLPDGTYLYPGQQADDVRWWLRVLDKEKYQKALSKSLEG